MADLKQGDFANQERFARTPTLGAERTQTGEGVSGVPESTEEKVRSMEVVASGSALEGVAGVATVVLAIIGLATHGGLPIDFMAIATIVAGAALIIHGGSMAGVINDALLETSEGSGGQFELGTGVTMEVAAGVAGVVLGILGIIGIVPVILSAVAVIAFGGALLLSSGAVGEMNELRLHCARVGAMGRQFTRRATLGAAGVQALVGVAAVVLGILGVLDIRAVTLTLVGLLCVGAAICLSGSAISARMMTFLSRLR